MNARQVLDREFLEVRGKILEIAASFDRIGRADGDVSEDPSSLLLRTGVEILSSSSDDRAKRIQLLFSLEYRSDWQDDFDLSPRSS